MIRPATPDDLAAIRACAEAAYARYVPLIGRRPAPMDADYAALVAQGFARVAEVEGAVRGFVTFWPKDDHLYLDAVAVHPDAAGRGLGRALVGAAEAAGRAAGLGEIRLYTNAAMTGNLTLYPHLGYRQVDRRRDQGFDRVFFVKDL
ncbi:GNAT family N-acetyltransferase [Pararhodobacter aggregans]|uniref:GNAT family N-acetyltransferase n=2 Tax=Pararhodobacter aggregans TaxID=404875 RepID=A0A2T7UJW1_9RHOB|nr:GNAT family N-acetyltransferase [Pararhodobacter aggregans]PVE44954.1 GNAT family N-acetyltransferase [Pararhodobacter aggregans]